METTKATFTNIRATIEDHIISAQSTIQIAVAWFTSKELIGALTDKVKSGISVEVIISDDFNNRKLHTKDFIASGGHLYVFPSLSGKFLHDKFALFDNRSVIVGSYNWTYSAEYKNTESVIISSYKTIVDQFRFRFNNLQRQVQIFSESQLLNTSNQSVGIIEEQLLQLEHHLEEKLFACLAEAKALRVPLDYTRIAEKITRYGAIGAIKRLLATGPDNVQSGFMKLWELGRLDLTFESAVIDSKFRALFDEKTGKAAVERLQKFGQHP